VDFLDPGMLKQWNLPNYPAETLLARVVILRILFETWSWDALLIADREHIKIFTT
jgi:hypothetical protein